MNPAEMNRSIQESFSASYWLKDAAAKLLLRDPLDARSDVAALHELVRLMLKQVGMHS